jgi:hypothetical protein
MGLDCAESTLGEIGKLMMLLIGEGVSGFGVGLIMRLLTPIRVSKSKLSSAVA